MSTRRYLSRSFIARALVLCLGIAIFFGAASAYVAWYLDVLTAPWYNPFASIMFLAFSPFMYAMWKKLG